MANMEKKVELKWLHPGAVLENGATFFLNNHVWRWHQNSARGYVPWNGSTGFGSTFFSVKHLFYLCLLYVLSQSPKYTIHKDLGHLRLGYIRMLGDLQMSVHRPNFERLTLPTDQLFNLQFQFESVFNLEFQPKFGILLGIPISIGINLWECCKLVWLLKWTQEKQFSQKVSNVTCLTVRLEFH